MICYFNNAENVDYVCLVMFLSYHKILNIAVVLSEDWPVSHIKNLHAEIYDLTTSHIKKKLNKFRKNVINFWTSLIVFIT